MVDLPSPNRGTSVISHPRKARRRALLIALMSMTSPLPGVKAAGKVSDDVHIDVGDSVVRLSTEVFGSGGLHYINVHENEAVSVKAARAVLSTRAGLLTELKCQRTRLISFKAGGVKYTFDPNRIFTDKGIEATFRKYGPYSMGAHLRAAAVADAIRAILTPSQGLPVIALHNNTPGDYSVLEYQAPGPEAENAARVAINPSLSPDDFFVVTDPAVFARLEAGKFNVVLQSSTPVDDGSLSVWFQQQGRSYINVEAQQSHLVEQQRMLEFVADA